MLLKSKVTLLREHSTYTRARFHTVEENLDQDKGLVIAPVWSVHMTGAPVLLTADQYQYVAYFDQDEYLTVAQRSLDTSIWKICRLADIQSNWETGVHHAIALQIDRQQMIHVMGAMHAEPLKYYRMTRAHDMASFQRYPQMLDHDETSVSYPRFFRDGVDALYVTYRDGRSGNGNQFINRYDEEAGRWIRVMSEPLLDGTALDMSAYINGPHVGPDGFFHLLWMWRNTPDVLTNHDLCYARSRDLMHWETITGTALTLPITLHTDGVIVDPVPVQSGLVNTTYTLSFDAQQRPLISYHKYDQDGNSQIYLARYTSEQWQIEPATRWSYRWQFGGTGAIPEDVHIDPVTVGLDGTLWLHYNHNLYGEGMINLDAQTLQPLHPSAPVLMPRAWLESYSQPLSPFTARPMTVDWIADTGRSEQEYVLRWEHGPINNDRPVAQPWPAPTLLRLYQHDR
ncbi:BNR repeat-containing protein [Dictyobacter arantiisoli]|uniref:BNR repeat-containing family member n=1 Tax=Dictyobacter arantiisoli TaxID=2014874 RepID=A0A5A5TG42_9CHLR|nr:BNR repeat-containing protein [Dictyobacter arantiisoli]GCF10126.1 hypothetical protein KDI_36900 [Dictyobacter arantiisoli]